MKNVKNLPDFRNPRPLSYLSEEDVRKNKISMLQHFAIGYVAYLGWCKELNVTPINFFDLK